MSDKKEKKKSGKKKIIVTVIIVVVLLIIGSVVAMSLSNKDDGIMSYKGLEVVKEDVASIIYTKGDVLAKESRNVAPSVSGKVEDVLVEEGDSVRKDDVLARIDKTNSEYSLKELEIQLAIGEENLKQIESKGSTIYKSAYANSKLTLNTSKEAYDNAVKLYDSGAYSKSQLDAARVDYDRSKNKYSDDKNNYYGVNNKSDIIVQEKRIESIMLQIEKLVKDIENTEIKSPIDGTITEINIKEMDPVGVTGAAFVVQNTNELEVVTRINQFDIGKINIGKEVKVTSDGVPGEEFVGKISAISSVAKKMQSGQSIETVVDVKIDLIGEEGKFRPYYSAKIEIAVEESIDATTIPYEAIYTDKDGKKIVYRMAEGIAEKLEIKLGVEGDLTVEVLDGYLTEGDVLIANPTNEITEGMAVTVTGVGEDDNDK